MPHSAFGPDFGLDLRPAAAAAMAGFMSRNPAPTPMGHLVRFVAGLLPEPKIEHHLEWDAGDCTGRALQAWVFAREMTGDLDTGRGVEAGQRKLIESLTDPELNVVLRPDPEPPFWHTWDQGRVLRGLVSRTKAGLDESKAICLLVSGLSKLARRGVDPVFGPWAAYDGDAYRRDRAVQDYYGIRAGQLLEPLVEWIEFSGDDSFLEFALELASATLSGCEGDFTPQEKYQFVFERDGAFSGHFHGHSSSVTGIARLGRYLITRNTDTERGREYLQTARRIYDWVFIETNTNRGSRIGWFPEGVYREKTRTLCEVCCAADMIELAAVLASCSELHSDFAGWEALWDDVESILLNTVLPAQFFNGEIAEELLERAGSPHWKSRGDILPLLEGGWSWAYLPNDLAYHRKDGCAEMLLFGCCQYAGVAALYTAWKNAARLTGDGLVVEMGLDRDVTGAKIRAVEKPEGLEITVSSQAYLPVKVRIPAWSQQNRSYLQLKATPESPARVFFPWKPKTTRELLGGPDRGDYFIPPEVRPEYFILWHGNRVDAMNPKGSLLPLYRT